MYSILVKDARCPRARCLSRTLARPANDGGKLYVCAVRSDVWLEPPYLSFVFLGVGMPDLDGGILHGLFGYEEFLKQYSSIHKKRVIFVQIAFVHNNMDGKAAGSWLRRDLEIEGSISRVVGLRGLSCLGVSAAHSIAHKTMCNTMVISLVPKSVCRPIISHLKS